MASPRFKRVVGLMAVLTVATYLAEPYVGARYLENLKAAPDFALATIDNSTFHLAEKNTRAVVILDFMAAWCVPCREELRQLADVRSMYTPSKVVLLSIDVAYAETAPDLAAFREANAGYNGSAEADGWYFALDSPDQYVGPKYGANALPTLVVIDGAGKIRHTWIGSVDAAQVRAAIDPLLATAA